MEAHDVNTLARVFDDAAYKALKRSWEAETATERDKQVVSAFLSGAALAANVCVVFDGEVTPQMVEKALEICAPKMGFKLGRL